MSNSDYAPVLLSVYNRVSHFKKCLSSLSKCQGAENTVVYISSDAAACNSDIPKVKEIRNFILNFVGFKTIIPVFSEENTKGRIIKDTYKIVFDKYSKLIRSEDDNIFAPTFLTFVNKGLITYDDREDIFSISGYNSPFQMPNWYNNDVYLRTGFTAWGVGLWRNKWEAVDWSLDSYLSMFSKKENFDVLKRDYSRYLPQLLKIRDTGVITGDGLILLHLLNYKMYSVYPTKTRVRNDGHDGSGINCGDNGTIYMNQKIYTGMEDPVLPKNLQPYPKLTKYIIKQIQPTLLEKTKLLLPPNARTLLKKFLRIR